MPDYIGPAVVCAMDPFCAMALSKLLTTHVLLPIYHREIQSGLYGPHSYFLSLFLIHLLSVVLYPMILTFIGFWLWDYTDDSFKNAFVWGLTMVFGAVSGSAVGIMTGIIIEDDIQASLVVFAWIMINCLGCGFIVNGNNHNWF